MNTSVTKLLIWLLCVVVVFFAGNYISNCTRQKPAITDTTISKYSILLDSINSLNRKVTTAKAEVAIGMNYAIQLARKNKDLQLLISAATAKEVVTYRNRIVPYTIYRIDTVNGRQCLELPVQFSKSDAWLKLAGSVTDTGIHYDSIQVAIAPTFEIGYSRLTNIQKLKGMQPEITVTITDGNPYVSAQSLKAIYIKPDPKKWYQTNAAMLGFGLIGGFIGSQFIK